MSGKLRKKLESRKYESELKREQIRNARKIKRAKSWAY